MGEGLGEGTAVIVGSGVFVAGRLVGEGTAVGGGVAVAGAGGSVAVGTVGTIATGIAVGTGAPDDTWMQLVNRPTEKQTNRKMKKRESGFLLTIRIQNRQHPGQITVPIHRFIIGQQHGDGRNTLQIQPVRAVAV